MQVLERLLARTSLLIMTLSYGGGGGSELKPGSSGITVLIPASSSSSLGNEVACSQQGVKPCRRVREGLQQTTATHLSVCLCKRVVHVLAQRVSQALVVAGGPACFKVLC